MRNLGIFSVFLIAISVTLACSSGEILPEDIARNPGEPLPGLTDEEMARFLLGKAVFTRLTSVEEGLGPTYNQVRCSGCHIVPVPGGSGTMETPLTFARRLEDGKCDVVAEEGGDIIQTKATPLLLAHGFTMPEEIPPSATHSVDEPALAMFGLGLVQGIPDEDIIALADPDDADGDGISGRVGVDVSGLPNPGRWTRKLERARLVDLVDAALRREIGLTTPNFPEEQTVNGVPVPPEADPMPEPEIDERGLNILTDFIRFMAPPAREPLTTQALRDSVEAGEVLFAEVGCAECHVPVMHTGPNEIAALDRKPVAFYSDLLLHDMGEELAGICGLYSSRAEYRTTWLWGLRHKAVFMANGQATTLRESIEWHGGESAASRDAFNALSAEEQGYLLRFLASL